MFHFENNNAKRAYLGPFYFGIIVALIIVNKLTLVLRM